MTAADRIAAASGPKRLPAFLAELSRIVEAGLGEAALLVETKACLASLVAVDDWLEDSFAQPSPEQFEQYLLFCDAQRRFSVVSFVWGPGQETPIHDHTTWGLVGLLRGGEVSEAYELRDGRPAKVDEELLKPGDVTVLFPAAGDIHKVRNAFTDRMSISIHVYGGDIGAIERHIYPSAGGQKRFVSGYSNRALPNLWGQT